MRKRSKNQRIDPRKRSKIGRGDYPAVFGDYDQDSIPDVDDPHPRRPGDVETIEEVKLSEEVGNLVDIRKGYVRAMDRVKRQLKKTGRGKVKGRVKTPYSLINKLRRKYLGDLTDVAGTMLVVEDWSALQKSARDIERSFNVLEKENFYRKPLGGYRAIHYIVEENGKPVEVQLKTERMAKISDASHTAYKRGTLNKKQMEHISRQAAEADEGLSSAAAVIDPILSDRKDLMDALTVSRRKNPNSDAQLVRRLKF